MSHPETTWSIDANRWRPDFPILATKVHGDIPLVYLDNAASTQHPRQVIQAMVNVYEQSYSNVHRGIHWLSELNSEAYERARELTRQFIGAADTCEVIFTSGTTAGINLVARSYGDANVRAGDEILLTELEHHSNIVPWQQLAQRTGAKVKFLPITDDGQLRLDLLDQYLSPRTKIVAVAAVSNVLGTINPLKPIIDKVHAAGAVVVVDAAQSVPHEPVNVQELGADFLAFSGHKMIGPSGIGVLWGKQSLLDAMPPFMGGGSMIRRVTTEGFESADLPAKFEAGTPPIVPAIGLGAAIEYLGQVGLANIHRYEQQLCQLAHESLSGIEGLQFLGPEPQRKAGIVSFVVDGVHPHDMAEVLDQHGIAIRAGHHCTKPLHKRLGLTASSRASFYFYNTPEEVLKLAPAVIDAKNRFGQRTRHRRQATPAHLAGEARVDGEGS